MHSVADPNQNKGVWWLSLGGVVAQTEDAASPGFESGFPHSFLNWAKKYDFVS
jgi:hypothetical protein